MQPLLAQDSAIVAEGKVITLSPVVVRSGLDAPVFMKAIESDTTFYKAFKNLRVLSFTSLNDIRMFDKKGRQVAGLNSKTKQHRVKGCRSMEVLQEKASGDFYDKKGEYNYYTAALYASLVFTKGTVCGETNYVGRNGLQVKGKSGMDKRKEQLKMLFFNPGKAIPGLPFIGQKAAVFSKEMAPYYDYLIDTEQYKGDWCYKFIAQAKQGAGDQVVINEMITYLDMKTMAIKYRKYDMSYKAGVYDFDVQMEVELMPFGKLLVPYLIRYNGNWDVAFQKREKGVFTATFFDYQMEK